MISVRSFFRVISVLRKLCGWPMAGAGAASTGIPIIRKMLKNAIPPAIRNGADGYTPAITTPSIGPMA
ncbi:hypothetical protein D3C84_1237080 [compost metagenome]